MVKNIEGKNISIVIKEEKIELPEEIRKKIEEYWEQCKLENPNLWNGELMCVGECKKEGNRIIIICKKSNYAHYLYDERVGLPKEYACSNLAAGCLLETSDNYYIVGELSEKHSFPKCMQISGGNVDSADIKDGRINIFNTIIRECQEELNISLQDKKHVEHFELKYMCVPTELVHTYILFAKGRLNMTKAQMQKYYEHYSEYLKENNLDIEFQRIHFIKKGRTTEELQNLKNPKRNYLKSLLEIDSKIKEVEETER